MNNTISMPRDCGGASSDTYTGAVNEVKPTRSPVIEGNGTATNMGEKGAQRSIRQLKRMLPTERWSMPMRSAIRAPDQCSDNNTHPLRQTNSCITWKRWKKGAHVNQAAAMTPCSKP